MELQKLYGIVALLAESHHDLEVLMPDQCAGLFHALFNLAHDAHTTYQNVILEHAHQGMAVAVMSSACKGARR